MLAIAAVPAVLLFVGMMTLPDSPRWYALKGRLDNSRRVLELTREPQEAKEEYESVVERDGPPGGHASFILPMLPFRAAGSGQP